MNELSTCIDGDVIRSKSIKEHTNHFIVVRDLKMDNGLKTKVMKCVFATPKVKVPGYILSEHIVEPEQKKIKCDSKVHVPQSKK